MRSCTSAWAAAPIHFEPNTVSLTLCPIIQRTVNDHLASVHQLFVMADFKPIGFHGQQLNSKLDFHVLFRGERSAFK